MDSKFSRAISRGKKKLAAKKSKEAAKKEKDAREHRLYLKRQRKAADEWVQEKLPAIIEIETAKGRKSYTFGRSVRWIEGRILADACKAVGLKTNVGCYADYGLQETHYSYSVVW